MASYVVSGYTVPDGVGSKSDVKAVQSFLVNEGYSVGTSGVDGIWGKNTQAAYEEYLSGAQKLHWQSEGGSSDTYDNALTQYKAMLDAAYESAKAKNELDAGRVKEQYQGARGQAYVNARLNAIGNNEALAAKGLAGNLYADPLSGVSESSRVRQDVAMRNSINAATNSENTALDDLALQLLQAGYTKDQEYAKYAAEIAIKKAEAQAEAERAYASALGKATKTTGSSGNSSRSRSSSSDDGIGLAAKALSLYGIDTSRYTNLYSKAVMDGKSAVSAINNMTKVSGSYSDKTINQAKNYLTSIYYSAQAEANYYRNSTK